MSRIRTIKPSFWTNARVVECSTNARLLFIGVWNFCDDFGNHPAAEKTIKGLIFPCDNFATDDIQRMLDELSANGLIEYYTIEKKRYLHVLGWNHQKIDRPQPPQFPRMLDEDSSRIRDGAIRGTIGDSDSSLRSESKKLPSGVKKRAFGASPPRKMKIPIPENEILSPQRIADAEKAGLAEPGEIDAEWRGFRDHHLAQATLLADWNAAWRRWLTKRHNFATKTNGINKPRPPPPAAGQARFRTASGLWVGKKFYPD